MKTKDRIKEYLRSGESESKGLGLEVEHFVVDDRGRPIDFHEVSELIDDTGRRIGAKIIYMDGFPVGYIAKDHSITLEPSCQFEISIAPYSDIVSIQRTYEDFLGLWEPLFAERGYHLVTKGNLPIVEKGEADPDDIPLSPKKRYRFMDSYFRGTGRYGKYMMRASASTQLSVDYRSEEDLVRKLSVLQKISPILMIGMENKVEEGSTLPESPNKRHLLRIQEWDDLDSDRTGFYPRSFDKGFGYDVVADVIFNTPLILLTDNGDTINVGSMSAKDLVSNGCLNDEETDLIRENRLIEHFISMGFFHFRIKKYIEIRVADSVPLDRALGYVALIKGLIYSDENLNLLEREFSFIDSEDAIIEAVEEIMINGSDAVIYEGKTASEWGGHLIGIALKALPDNEKEYLEHVRAFWSIG